MYIHWGLIRLQRLSSFHYFKSSCIPKVRFRTFFLYTEILLWMCHHFFSTDKWKNTSVFSPSIHLKQKSLRLNLTICKILSCFPPDCVWEPLPSGNRSEHRRLQQLRRHSACCWQWSQMYSNVQHSQHWSWEKYEDNNYVFSTHILLLQLISIHLYTENVGFEL